VRQRIGANCARDLDLALGDQRPRGRGSEEVLAVVDRACAEHREDEVADELLAEVLDVALLGARRDRFRADSLELDVTLPYVGGDADDARPVVVLLEPRNNDRGVETARVGENDE
jgi:hypothetical protein